MRKRRRRVTPSAERVRTLSERRNAPALRFYRIQDLVARYSVSRKTIWTWWAHDVVTPRLPAPIAIAPGTKVWPAEAIEAWERERIAVATSNRGAA